MNWNSPSLHDLRVMLFDTPQGFSFSILTVYDMSNRAMHLGCNGLIVKDRERDVIYCDRCFSRARYISTYTAPPAPPYFTPSKAARAHDFRN